MNTISMDTTTSTTAPDTAARDGAAAPDDDLLAALLDAELAFGPVARGGFINHLAMSLVAARRLGASDDELHEWFDGQASSDFLIPRDRPDWLDRDIARIETVGIGAEVRRRLPSLIAAPESQFFHAVIRLELALDAGHPGQVANALQNWSDHARPLAAPPDGSGNATFGQVMDAVLSHPLAAQASQLSTHQVAAERWFADALADLRGDGALLDEVAAVAVASHVEPRNFGTLHLVTGTRATRAVARHLGPDDADELALRTAHAAGAGLLSFGATLPSEVSVAQRRDRSTPEWATIARGAVDSGDPHVAKLVYACQLEEAATGDPLYRSVAAHQVG